MQYKNVLARPVQSNQNAWNLTLWYIHLQSYTNTNSLDLKVPLGAWTSGHSTSRRWKAYQDKNTVYSWVIEDSNWKKYRVYGNCLLESHQLVTKVKYDTITPVQIDDTTSSNVFVSYSTRFTPSKSPEIYGPTISWDNYVDSQPTWIRSLLQNVYFFTENGKLDMELILKDQ